PEEADCGTARPVAGPVITAQSTIVDGDRPMLARYARFLTLVLAALSAPAALAQPRDRPATPGNGSTQEFLKNFETKHKKALAEGNYDINQWNSDVSLFIHRCTSLPVKADYAIELCEQQL